MFGPNLVDDAFGEGGRQQQHPDIVFVGGHGNRGVGSAVLLTKADQAVQTKSLEPQRLRMLQTAAVGVFKYALSYDVPYLRKWLALEHCRRRNGFNSDADFTHRLLLPAKVRHVSNISFGRCKTNRYPKEVRKNKQPFS